MRQKSCFGAPCPRLSLVFIDKGVQINGEYYKMEVLDMHLLPTAWTFYEDDYFCFHHTQQTAFNSGTAKICLILFPKLSSLSACQI
jgi:hypothetical protein